MVGTAFDTMGGISSVVNVYRAQGLFSRWPVLYLSSHRDGSAFAKVRASLGAWLRFVGLLLARRAALLHIHVSSRASFWRKSTFFWLAYWLGVPTVVHLHGSEFAIFYERECRPWQRALVRALFNRASRVVVLSADWQAWLRGISRNPRVEAIYNPVLLPAATDWAAREAGTVLFLGRLGKRKGSYDLLDAVALLGKRGLRPRLLLGGDGELEQVRERARALGIADQLEMLGWVRGRDKQRLLDRAMVYALPSYNEGLPMSVLEAMASGLPILSTPIGGIPEAVIDGEQGYLVQPGDVTALADRLQRLLVDTDHAAALGAAARARVAQTFAADVLVPRVEQLYRELGARPVSIG